MPPESGAASADTDKVRASIAIVEDEFLVALQLEDILLEGGYHVVATAPDLPAAEAISQTVDVALVDLNLRDGLTGPEIARRLSTRFGTRIVYVTANPGQIGVPAETAMGVLHKPFSRKAIEATLEYALDQSLTVARPRELEPLERHPVFRSA
ncbi:response regulator [Novosphingobium sp. RD2P27]|uniref:Response regulator n=1 Tax=Novosphingobium kalidii TaxID=3230299 RepID=A0ABV2CYP9_9SPHN